MSDQFSCNPQVAVVPTFAELVDDNFQEAVNAVCWERNLEGDFKEIVSKLQLRENITEVTSDDLLSLQLSKKGQLAREIILNDLKLLSDFEAMPTLNLLKSYERDDEFDFIETDVYSYHVDRSPVGTNTFLCTYYGAASDILPNDQATQKILIPEIREKLRAIYEGSEDGFENFLEENYFDLHYQPNSDALPINLGLGHLWKLAVDNPEQKVLPCIHRAPKENDGEYRLLLIC
ncbi:DUF1826 domain-containing protein [Epilithonimonas sp. JDS]|uniref:DUF1826 domain-containing protein n=1 Tax=Epilithonimonas sp. JDS TaxID=2902797 RepID=UPI001E575751|nr:DUF1826 domain-containing protein [Epilithonimonas sp. JDS]MCD9856300.1 DUF1826 domain-containing protein [Epilithonimonas sp. JDS]